MPEGKRIIVLNIINKKRRLNVLEPPLLILKYKVYGTIANQGKELVPENDADFVCVV